MKITNLYVDDRRSVISGRDRRYRDPTVEVSVDEPVEETGMRTFSQLGEGAVQYAIISCGPFFAVEACAPSESSAWVDLEDEPLASWGDVNKIGLLPDGKQLFPVNVHTLGDEVVLPLSMEVPRLRRLIRKFRMPYEIIVDEQAAVQGKLQWRLESDPVLCYGGALTDSDAVCFQPPVSTVLWRNTHFPLCTKHLDQYQTMRRERRVS